MRDSESFSRVSVSEIEELIPFYTELTDEGKDGYRGTITNLVENLAGLSKNGVSRLFDYIGKMPDSEVNELFESISAAACADRGDFMMLITEETWHTHVSNFKGLHTLSCKDFAMITTHSKFCSMLEGSVTNLENLCHSMLISLKTIPLRHLVRLGDMLTR